MKKIHSHNFSILSLKKEKVATKNNFLLAFTLVEMIISVTISIFLLWALSVFMWTWMEAILFQKQNLEAFKSNSSIYSNIYKNISWASNFKTIYSNSWVIFKINRRYNKWWFAYIWEKIYNKKFCQTWSLGTNHLIIKTFIPFENIWADFLAWTSYSSWVNKTYFFKWKVDWVSWKFSWPTDFLKKWTDIYISDTLDNTIKKNWTVIVWKSWIFWNYFKEGIDATKVLLNNPTWLAYWEWKLFFSDSLNDRILYLDSWKVYSLLDEKDWLNEPTWLFYDNSRKALFIANSWNWNILEFSSSWITNNPDLVFTGITNSNVSKFEIEFLNSSWTWWFIDLTWPTATWSFNFSWQWEDFLTLTWSKLTYYLEEYNGSEELRSECDSAPKYVMDINWINPIKCTQTGTWIVWIPRNNVNLYNKIIKVSDISPDFPNDNYFVKVDMWGNTKYFPYFTKSDNLVSTKFDNNLREIAKNLACPTWIKVIWNNLIVNSFLDRKQYKINLANWNKTNNWNLTWFSNFKNLSDNNISDYISDFPIKWIDFWKDWNLLSIILKTYKKYNCLDNSKNIEDIEIIKKIIR